MEIVLEGTIYIQKGKIKTELWFCAAKNYIIKQAVLQLLNIVVSLTCTAPPWAACKFSYSQTKSPGRNQGRYYNAHEKGIQQLL
jgi:hypothetical protein